MTIQTVYRGTQLPTIEGVRKGQSFAYSLPVAIIWSARPGDIWARRPNAQFLETSTVHRVQVDAKNPLMLSTRNHTTLADILRALQFGKPDGITDDEVRKIYNYLHNRIIGKAAGGEFSYMVVDEEGDERDEDEVPLSFRNPQSMITLARDDWDFAPGLDTAEFLIADTYIFADAPAAQRVAMRLGHDVMIYPDVFQGGEDAAKELLGCAVHELDGITEEIDLKGENVPEHGTLRLLDPASVIDIASAPTASFLTDQRYC
jgi:hypothetical protein